MPARPRNIPHNVERTALQKLRVTKGLAPAQLHPAGKGIIANMLAKGWIESQLDARAGARYCITPAGEAALKAKIPAGSVRKKQGGRTDRTEEPS